MEWPLLTPLGPEERAAVLRAARPRTFRRHEVVFHEGDPGDAMHLLEQGHVTVRTTTPLGDVATLRVLGPGSVFGELAVLAPAPRSATITAVEQARTLVLRQADLAALRASHPGVDRMFLHALAEEVRRLSGQLAEALYVPVPRRIRRRLLELHRLYSPDGRPVALPFSQEDLAGLAGTTRPTVNKELNELQATGVLRTGRGRIEVLDARELARRAG